MYHWSPLALLKSTTIVTITNSWPMVKKITSTINSTLDSMLNVVHHTLDTTVDSVIDYLLTTLPDSNTNNNRKQ